MAIIKRNTSLKILPNPVDLFQAAAEDFMLRAKNAIESKGVFTVVLSGGSTAKLFFDVLVESYKNKISWSQIQFFFGDERYLPADDKENNSHIAQEHLFSKVAVPPENIHRMPTEFPEPHNAAKDYESTLRKFFHIHANEFPKFDLIYLGLGENAHTASLMPHSEIVKTYSNNASIKESHQLVASLFVPELKMYRITLTPNAINHAECIIFLVSGENKALAVREVLEGPILPEEYPAQLIQSLHGKTIWYLDQASAEKLT
jgi:6-phosphogluconolactonase